jgi:hypothetical protein
MVHAARALLANQQGGRVLEQMVASPHQRLKHKLLTGVVVHSATVFISKQKSTDDILLPFINILNNPAALKVYKYVESDVFMYLRCTVGNFCAVQFLQFHDSLRDHENSICVFIVTQELLGMEGVFNPRSL